MKKKILAASLAAVAAVGLAACGGNDEPTSGGDWQKDNLDQAVTLNFDVQYAGSAGIANREETYTDIDGKPINQGDLLPMWQEIQRLFNVTITDGCYAQSKDDQEYQMAIGTHGGKDDKGNQINVFSNTMTNIVSMAKAESLVPLDELIDAGMMPNFKKYLEENPAIKKQLTVTVNGEQHIYATPYFDGVDSIEKMFQMNVPWVELLLDGKTEFSSYANANVKARPKTYDGAGSGSHSGAWAYQPFYTEDINTTVATVNSAGTGLENVKINIPANKNIIAQMNAKPNATGAEYVEMFRDYIDEIYGDYIGNGKLWSKRSEIFTGASACYNADELVALMRIVSLNTKPLTGGTEQIVVMAPRGMANNRYVNILNLASMWGVRGLTSMAEQSNLYYDNEGKVHTAMSESTAYDALDNLHALYQDGLILEDFTKAGTSGGNVYRDNILKAGRQFLVYDYSASISEVDDSYQFKEMSSSYLDRFEPVLPPYAQWHANGSDDNSFTRFSEDSRALKNGGWCILSASSKEQVARAATIFDYFFCDEGADLQDFGLNNTSYRLAKTEYDSETGERKEGAGTAKMSDGTVYVVIGEKAKKAIGQWGSWTNFYRQRVGATFPIGHIRQDALDYQVGAPSAQTGLAKINLAISLGAMDICTAEGQDNNPFFKCIPTVIDMDSTIKTAIDTQVTTLNDLWKQDGGYINVIQYGWSNSTGGTASKQSYLDLFGNTNNYLKQYQTVLDKLN